jgi:hypothetical protein
MPRFLQTTKSVSLPSAAGGAQTTWVWDNPVSEPLREFSIILSSEGREHAIGDFTWTVFFITKWDGVPFGEASTPIAGVSVATGTITCPLEVYRTIYTHTSYFPANKKVVDHMWGAQDLSGEGGAAIAVRVVNDTIAAPVNLKVVFVAGTISDSK